MASEPVRPLLWSVPDEATALKIHEVLRVWRTHMADEWASIQFVEAGMQYAAKEVVDGQGHSIAWHVNHLMECARMRAVLQRTHYDIFMPLFHWLIDYYTQLLATPLLCARADLKHNLLQHWLGYRNTASKMLAVLTLVNSRCQVHKIPLEACLFFVQHEYDVIVKALSLEQLADIEHAPGRFPAETVRQEEEDDGDESAPME